MRLHAFLLRPFFNFQSLVFAIVVAGLSVSVTGQTIVPKLPLQSYSGIYPHMAASNTHKESGIGAILKRGNTIWYATYGPHITKGGSDELYSLDLTTFARTIHSTYPGNTDANRYTDTRLGIDVIGAAYIDKNDTVRYLPATRFGDGDLVGRITGTAAHLTDPDKLYYMTMEEGLYEVDFSDLDHPVITTLRVDGNFDDDASSVSGNLPGVHGKGLATGQGKLFFSNNGMGNGGKGLLAEWDGNGDAASAASWNIVDQDRQYTEVTSRRGPVDMGPDSTDPIWATGWVYRMAKDPRCRIEWRLPDEPPRNDVPDSGNVRRQSIRRPQTAGQPSQNDRRLC